MTTQVLSLIRVWLETYSPMTKELDEAIDCLKATYDSLSEDEVVKRYPFPTPIVVTFIKDVLGGEPEEIINKLWKLCVKREEDEEICCEVSHT